MNRVYSVGQVNTYVKRLFTNDYLLKHMFVKGEVSNCKYHSSGHIYFSLKDETGTLLCVMFKTSRMTGLKFELENGQEVVIEGSVSVYERDGRYQFYAKSITLSGAGDLHLRYEALKQKLYEEGLFDFECKKPICKYPKTVGVVTAKTGAAIEDIKNIAKRRNPYVQLILYPAKVQGDGAAESIVRGIEKLDAYGVDTIIVGRGGGSIEDLWAFNEEIVARAIYACRTPVISGTGHEIDNTIADYVSDLRAPTPSAACELAIPDVMSTLDKLEQYSGQMAGILNRRLDYVTMRLDAYEKQLIARNPRQRLMNQQMYLDELSDRLKRVWDRKYEQRVHRLMLLATQLDGLSPTKKLINGFGYIERESGEPLTSREQVGIGDSLKLTISDAVIQTRVEDVQGL